MLKFLTHKLKNHSINEDNPHQKVDDDDHDSGTESDDEHGTSDEPEISMESEGCSVATALSRSRSSLLTPASPFLDSALPSDCDQGYDQHSSEEELEVINCHQPKHSSSTGQEKRKWSQVTPEMGSSERGSCRTGPRTEVCSSSDDEVRTTPVQFRTSPPRGTHRPAQLMPQEASPRKRHRNTAPPRPCLDFEKMQQLKARTWRHGGDTGSGEQPVYCW